MSEKTIFDKIKFVNDKHQLLVLNCPEIIKNTLLQDLTYDEKINNDYYDFIIIFLTNVNDDLRNYLTKKISNIKYPQGRVYIAYPKKTSKLFKDSLHTRDTIWSQLISINMKPIFIYSMTDDFSLIRIKDDK